MHHDVIDSYVFRQGFPSGWMSHMIPTLFSAALFFIGLLFLVSILFRWLWNITMPKVFGLPEITYWEAFRLILIAGILFGRIRLG